MTGLAIGWLFIRRLCEGARLASCSRLPGRAPRGGMIRLTIGSLSLGQLGSDILVRGATTFGWHLADGSTHYFLD